VSSSDTAFPHLVSLAAHDLRTPLATIHGFAQTLVRMGDLGEPKQRYVEMIDAASRQLAELLDELGVAARIESGRYEPHLQPVDTLELARVAAEELGELQQVELRVDGSALTISPVTASSGPVLLGHDLRDLGAAVAVIVVHAIGGSVDLAGDTLSVHLPA
jgi:two-component system OmpR family sensor kinase